MCESIRHHPTGRHALQSIVANGRRRSKALFDVAGFELDLSLRCASWLRGRVAPDAREAIGLQLEPYRQRILSGRIVVLRGANLAFYSGEPLHVMTNFVRDHICAREIA